MTVTAVLLLVFSAFTHAGWNLIGKRSRSNAGAFLIASGAGVVLLLPFVLLYGGATAFFDATHNVYDSGATTWDISYSASHDWIMAGYPHLQWERTDTVTNAVQLQLMILDLDNIYH